VLTVGGATALSPRRLFAADGAPAGKFAG